MSETPLPDNTIPNISYDGLYNCDFVVRYYDIEYELLEKLRERQKKIEAAEKDPQSQPQVVESDPKKKEYYYTNSDVKEICNKLYRDELLSVFYADSIEDENIDIQMRVLLVLLSTNPGFRSIVDDMINILLKMGDTPNEDEKKELKTRSKMIIFSTLFSHQLFYITHQCIIQMLRKHTIDDILINALRSKTVDMFNEDGTSKNRSHETKSDEEPEKPEQQQPVENVVISSSEPSMVTNVEETSSVAKKTRVNRVEPIIDTCVVGKPKGRPKKVKHVSQLNTVVNSCT